MKINTTPGETYIVLSTGGCTVTTGAGKQIKKLAAGQDFFTAMTGESILSDDNASVIEAKGEILSMLNTDGTGAEVQATLRFQPVTSQSALPATGENGVIYLVPNGKTAPNQYTEWVWTGAAYEQLGDAGVDLSGYAKLNAANTFTTTQKFNTGLEAGDIILSNPAPEGGTTMTTLFLGADAQLTVAGGGINLYTDRSGVATLYIGSNAKITGPGYIDEDSDAVVSEAESVLTPVISNHQVYISSKKTGWPEFKSCEDVTKPYSKFVQIEGANLQVDGGILEVSGAGSWLAVTNMATLTIGEGSTISGPGWETIVADIQSGAASSAVAALVEPEQPSFTKLIFPPTGTATEEQDPSWITKKNILMETSGGQLNMTQLTATLAYAAQNRFDIAKRTLWLSTSPGSGDAVQWPANAVFPDDQPQDKIQQLNSNSTYWFDITYVGGSDIVLIRKVCSWASTTGENGPTD